MAKKKRKNNKNQDTKDLNKQVHEELPEDEESVSEDIDLDEELEDGDEETEEEIDEYDESFEIEDEEENEDDDDDDDPEEEDELEDEDYDTDDDEENEDDDDEYDMSYEIEETKKASGTKKAILALLVILTLTGLAFIYKSELVVATVNGKPITRAQLIAELEKQGGSQTLDSLITQELIKQEAKNRNIVISDEDLQKEIDEIATTVAAQGMTLEQALELQGSSMERFREQVRLQLVVDKIVVENVEISDEEVTSAMQPLLDNGQEDSQELRDQVKAQLAQTKIAQATQEFILGLRENANINILKEY